MEDWKEEKLNEEIINNELEKRILEETYRSIENYENCSYIKKKIEEFIKTHNIIKFDTNRKKTIKLNRKYRKRSYNVINFSEKREKVVRSEEKENHGEDKNKQLVKEQNDDDILML